MATSCSRARVLYSSRLVTNATAPISTAVPAAAGASMDVSGGTAGQLVARGVGVIGFSISIFKLEQHMQGPIATLNRQCHRRLTEAVLWCKLGNLDVRDGSREAWALATGTKKLAHSVTPLKHESNVWVDRMTTGMGIFWAGCISFIASSDFELRQTMCVFCQAIVKHLRGGSFGDVTLDDAPGTDEAEKEEAGIRSVTGQGMFSFGAARRFSQGFRRTEKRLTGAWGWLRPEGDTSCSSVQCTQSNTFLPVCLSPRCMSSAETHVPTKRVFRALKHGAF